MGWVEGHGFALQAKAMAKRGGFSMLPQHLGDWGDGSYHPEEQVHPHLAVLNCQRKESVQVCLYRQQAGPAWVLLSLGGQEVA